MMAMTWRARGPNDRRMPAVTTGVSSTMARREKIERSNGFVLFDVLYEDGTRSSNRRVPSFELSGLDGDAPAKPYIEAQDRKIAEMSGNPRGPVKSVSRSPNR